MTVGYLIQHTLVIRRRSAGVLAYNPPADLQDNPVSQEDKIWYVIEDALGRKNWGQINLTIPANYRG